MPEAALTCLDFWCKAGSVYEEKGEEGIAHFLEHMSFKGSKNLQEGEFDLKIEALGGSSNAATGLDDVHFYILVPPVELEKALECLLDLVITPTIANEAFQTERQVVLEELAQQNDQPDEILYQKLLGSCWANHPYSRPILGTTESLNSLCTSSMVDFHSKRYRGSNCTLAIAGNVPKDIEKIINNSQLTSIQSISSNNWEMTQSIKVPFTKGKIEVAIERLESARILIAWPASQAKDQKDIMGFDLATSILAEGRRSLLVHRLREELQIIDSIDIDISIHEAGGIIILELCCLEIQLIQVEKELHSILSSCLTRTITKAELNRAKQLVRNGYYFGIELSSQVSSLAGTQTLWERNQNLLYPLSYLDYWTAERLQEIIFPKLQLENSFTLIAKSK